MELQETPKPHYLSTRPNWEAAANVTGATLEHAVASVLHRYLETVAPGQFRVEQHPKDLEQLYLEEDYRLNPSSYEKPTDGTASSGDIYWDSERKEFLKFNGRSWVRALCGCIPDVKVTHTPSGQSYFIECKAQGDAGNAQERACKYATPSFLQAIQRRMGVEYHPIGYLFSGELVKKKKYVLELQLSFGFARDHLILWDPARPCAALEEWAERVLRPLLGGGAASASA